MAALASTRVAKSKGTKTKFVGFKDSTEPIAAVAAPDVEDPAQTMDPYTDDEEEGEEAPGNVTPTGDDIEELAAFPDPVIQTEAEGLRISRELLDAFLSALGGGDLGSVTLEDFAYIPAEDVVSTFPSLLTRDLIPLEKGKLLRLHARAVKIAIEPDPAPTPEVQAAILPVRTVMPAHSKAPPPSVHNVSIFAPPAQAPSASVQGLPALTLLAGIPPAPRGGDVYHIHTREEDDTKRKFDDYLEQGLPGSFEVLHKDAVSILRKNYQRLMGTKPGESKRPSNEQLSALKARLDSNQAPYADFGVFGPFGRLSAKLRKYEIKTLVGDRLISKLVSGPSDYHAWLGSWEVFKTSMIMLEAASPGALEAYAEGIRHLTVFFPNSWGDIALADVDMRDGHWERMLEETDGNPAGYNPLRPWDYIITQSAYGDSNLRGSHWWEMNLVKALQSPESTQTVIARMDGRPVQAHRYPANSNAGTLALPPQPPRRQAQGPSSSTSLPSATCSAFNEGRCNSNPCPYGLAHSCSHCGGKLHQVKQCFQLFGRPPPKGSGKGSGAAAPPPAGKGAKGDKKGDKRKRRGGVKEITATTLDYTY
jgi:hypothetical protein